MVNSQSQAAPESGASQAVKVLHVTFDMAIGGTEQVIRQIVESCNDDIQHSILCIDGKIGEIGQILKANKIEVLSYSRKQGFDYSLVTHIRELIRLEKFQVVHCHQYTPYVYGVVAAAFTSARVIFTEHGRFYPDRYSWKRRLLNPIFSLFTFSIVAISKATANALIHYEWFPERSLQVIYNGLTPLIAPKEKVDKLRDDYKLSGKNILGTIARLDPIKNHAMMLRGFKKVLQQHPNSVLIIVGDGPYRIKTEELVKELGLSDNVIFTGFVTDPSPFFGLIDVFLLPSLSEGTSMTLLEAMANGKPAVVTDVGGNPEIVINGQTGLITPSQDCGLFGAAILELIESPLLKYEMGRAARCRYEQLFTVHAMVNSYKELYGEASGGNLNRC